MPVKKKACERGRRSPSTQASSFSVGALKLPSSLAVVLDDVLGGDEPLAVRFVGRGIELGHRRRHHAADRWQRQRPLCGRPISKRPLRNCLTARARPGRATWRVLSSPAGSVPKPSSRRSRPSFGQWAFGKGHWDAAIAYCRMSHEWLPLTLTLSPCGTGRGDESAAAPHKLLPLTLALSP